MGRMIGVLTAIVVVLAAPAARAHFQMILPATDVVESGSDRALRLELVFTHPMEGGRMDMPRPTRFGVAVRDGEPVDLLAALEPKETDGRRSWGATYEITRPGDHVFFVEPAPYWEPAEDTFIIHYTKVVVNAFGDETGWDRELGLKTEIVPLVRPYGLWAGNVFRGVVKRDGKPVPFAEIEVEYYNPPGEPPVEAPTGAHVTQVIKADANGVFTYAMPRAGWWGFAALTEPDFTLKGEDGKEHAVELGAVMWMRTVEMK